MISKRSTIQFSGFAEWFFFVLKTYSTINSSQNRSKIKLVGENAVIRVHESCSPLVMYPWQNRKPRNHKIKRSFSSPLCKGRAKVT